LGDEGGDSGGIEATVAWEGGERVRDGGGMTHVLDSNGDLEDGEDEEDDDDDDSKDCEEEDDDEQRKVGTTSQLPGGLVRQQRKHVNLERFLAVQRWDFAFDNT
jgi:hypothetical protein